MPLPLSKNPEPKAEPPPPPKAPLPAVTVLPLTASVPLSVRLRGRQIRFALRSAYEVLAQLMEDMLHPPPSRRSRQGNEGGTVAR